MNSEDLSISASAAFVLQWSISSLGCLNMGPRVKLRTSCWHDKHDPVISTVLKCACYHITAGSSGISCCICFPIKAKISKFTVEVWEKSWRSWNTTKSEILKEWEESSVEECLLGVSVNLTCIHIQMDFLRSIKKAC